MSLLNSVKHYPSGNTFGNKVKTIKTGKATQQELDLIRYATLFNIIEFNHDGIEPGKLQTLTTELENLENSLGIKYCVEKFSEVQSGDRYLYSNGLMRERSEEELSRTDFVNHVINQLNSDEKDNQSRAEQFSLSCHMHANESGILSPRGQFSHVQMAYNAHNFSIYYNGNERIDLAKPTTNNEYDNSHFLTQIMSGETFTDFSGGGRGKEYDSVSLYRLADKSQSKENRTASQKQALAIISKRQRMQSLVNVFNKVKNQITNLLHPKGKDENEYNK